MTKKKRKEKKRKIVNGIYLRCKVDVATLNENSKKMMTLLNFSFSFVMFL